MTALRRKLRGEFATMPGSLTRAFRAWTRCREHRYSGQRVDKCRRASLPSDRHVALYSCAIHLAAQMIRRAGREVHQRAVVPEHHVVLGPHVTVQMLRPHAVRENFFEQLLALVFG